jgi:hypothetical protein
MGIPKRWMKEAKNRNCSGKDRQPQVRRRTNLAQKRPLIYNARTISSHVTGEKPELAFRPKVGIHREA